MSVISISLQFKQQDAKGAQSEHSMHCEAHGWDGKMESLGTVVAKGVNKHLGQMFPQVPGLKAEVAKLEARLAELEPAKEVEKPAVVAEDAQKQSRKSKLAE